MTTKISYPSTARDDVTDDYFGVTIPDPFRWLENDAHSDAAVGSWIDAQNSVTESYLGTLPGRDVFRDRIRALMNYEQYSLPKKAGDRYFYLYQPGQANQFSLRYRQGLIGEDRNLIDPNSWSTEGTTALAEWSPSDDGKYVAYAVQQDGSDWRTIKVKHVDTGEELGDEVHWARYSTIEWAGDNSGFFYSRFPEPEGGRLSQAELSNHAIYFHRLGTEQSADRLLYGTPEQPNLIHTIKITDDGRYAIVTSTPGGNTNALTVVDLTTPGWTIHKLVQDFAAEWYVVGMLGSKFFIMTTDGADRRKIVTRDLATRSDAFEILIPQQESAMNAGSLVGGRLIITYLVDAVAHIHRYRLDGSPDGMIDLPGLGVAGGFQGRVDENETFFIFTSYDTPVTVYRYDVAANAAFVWAKPEVPADLNKISVVQHFYRSSDGTRIPMMIVRREDSHQAAAPTLLHGYGGFGISALPIFSAVHLAWVEQGGILAVPNIRGGGEYGEKWHNAARGRDRQKAFDDFIAAGEYLLAEGITPQGGLAIQGESNGGLLVGAVTNQRPDLFAAALPGVPVMDMIRYNKFSGGFLWIPEFGDPSDADSFYTLLAYSPYHNVRAGTTYPAILVTTADADDRAPPSHAFKYIAALQAEGASHPPRLARIDRNAGHGAGKPLDKYVAERADMWTFAAHWTGLTVEGCA